MFIFKNSHTKTHAHMHTCTHAHTNTHASQRHPHTHTYTHLSFGLLPISHVGGWESHKQQSSRTLYQMWEITSSVYTTYTHTHHTSAIFIYILHTSHTSYTHTHHTMHIYIYIHYAHIITTHNHTHHTGACFCKNVFAFESQRNSMGLRWGMNECVCDMCVMCGCDEMNECHVMCDMCDMCDGMNIWCERDVWCVMFD